MKEFSKIFQNTSAQVVSRVISSGTGFLVTLLIARHYGIGGYSDIAKITALVSLFYLCIDLGANAIFLQLDQKSQNLSHFLSFRLFLAGGIFLLLAFFVWILPYNNVTTSGYPPLVKIGILLFALSYFSRAVVFTSAAFFQQKLLYARATIASLASSAMTLGIITGTVVLQGSLLWVIAAYLFGGFAEGLVSLWYIRKSLQFPFSLPFSFVKKLFWQTLPLTLLLFLNLLYFRLDMVILSFLQPSSAVGLYDYAYRFFDFLIALPLFLSNTLYPNLLRLEKNSRIQRTNISLYTLLFFFMGAVLVFPVYFLAPLIALVKPAFAPSITALRILVFSLPVFFATNILQWIFIAKKKQVVLVWVYGGSLLLNVLLNIVFIPRYSYLGSAIITDVSELLILGIMLVLFFTTHL